MTYCAKCGHSVETLSKINPKYIELGGPLQKPNQKNGVFFLQKGDISLDRSQGNYCSTHYGIKQSQ